jgi:uncharacterized protein (TIGR03435 family)
MRHKTAFCVGAALVLAASLAAQAPGFEVASVRRHTGSDTATRGGSQPDGGYVGVNMTLRNLLVAAYSLPSSRIVGGPRWLDSERWDVHSKGPRTNNAPANLQALLSERLAVAIRRERREFSAYYLVKSNPDGRLGPGLTPARFNCDDPDGRTAAVAANSKDQKSPRCGIRQQTFASVSQMQAGGVTLNMIVGYLGAGRQVVDRTGLPGRYDVVLEWAPTPDGDGPSIFTALRDQLGLRLDNARITLDVVVIERAERPQPQ